MTPSYDLSENEERELSNEYIFKQVSTKQIDFVFLCLVHKRKVNKHKIFIFCIIRKNGLEKRFFIHFQQQNTSSKRFFHHERTEEHTKTN